MVRIRYLHTHITCTSQRTGITPTPTVIIRTVASPTMHGTRGMENEFRSNLGNRKGRDRRTEHLLANSINCAGRVSWRKLALHTRGSTAKASFITCASKRVSSTRPVFGMWRSSGCIPVRSIRTAERSDLGSEGKRRPAFTGKFSEGAVCKVIVVM